MVRITTSIVTEKVEPLAPLVSDSTPSPEAILQIGMGFWGSKTLLRAVDIGLFTTLAAGALTAEDLAKALDLPAPEAQEFLDALVALGMLEREGDRYFNTCETDYFLDRNKPFYVGGLLQRSNTRR
jgi:hypothetical protein